ncbi:MAG: HAD family hydrolase [Nanoarchaeota archaeon]
MKPLICFDMDETLIYSDKAHIKAFNKVFVNNGLKKIPEKRLERALTGETTEMIIKKFYPKLNKKLLNKIIKERRNIVIKETSKYARAIPGAISALKKLKKKYRIAIISNCVHREMLALLKGAKIKNKLFDKLIGKDEVKHPKPYPDEIFKAEKLFHENADYLVGDSVWDIKAAKKAKVKIVTVLTGNTPKEKLIKAKPDYIIKSIKELPKILKKGD